MREMSTPTGSIPKSQTLRSNPDTGPAVAASVDELLAGASSRTAMDKHVDSLSGSPFERAVIDGRPYIVKHIGYDLDWLARALGDRDCFALTMWRTGLLHALPSEIDPATVGVAHDPASGRVSMLMHDIGQWLVPAGSDAVPLATHRQFLTHMATMHARFWDFTGVPGLLDPGARYTALTPGTGEREAAAGHDDPVPRALGGGWAALHAAAPAAHELAIALVTDPAPLVAAFAETPATLIHGDWKFGNLGAHPDGRTILLDWGWPGRAAPLADVAWYLAVNCDRLPESKEYTVAAYRGALEAQGIATSGWWERQLGLALVGGFLQLGWSKTGDAAELAWWVDRIVPVARELVR
jgi:Phosphotransferase enzyme family